MSARVEQVVAFHRPRRGILKPILGWAFVAALIAVIRRIARQPTLPRMSEQWLQSRQTDFSREQY